MNLNLKGGRGREARDADADADAAWRFDFAWDGAGATSNVPIDGAPRRSHEPPPSDNLPNGTGGARATKPLLKDDTDKGRHGECAITTLFEGRRWTPHHERTNEDEAEDADEAGLELEEGANETEFNAEEAVDGLESPEEDADEIGFESLPVEVRTKILSFIPRDHLIKCARTSKCFLKTVYDSSLWRNLTLENLGPIFWRNVEKASECLEQVPTIETLELDTDNMRWLDPGFADGACMVLQGLENVIDVHPEIKRLTFHANPLSNNVRYNVGVLDHVAKAVGRLHKVEHLHYDFFGFIKLSIPDAIFSSITHLNRLQTLHLQLDCYELPSGYHHAQLPTEACLSANALDCLLNLPNVHSLGLLGTGWGIPEWINFLREDAPLYRTLKTVKLETCLHEDVYCKWAVICSPTLKHLHLNDSFRRSRYAYSYKLITNAALKTFFQCCPQLESLVIRPKVRPFPEEVPVSRFVFTPEEEASFKAKFNSLEIHFLELDRTGYDTIRRCFASTLTTLKILEEDRICPLRLIVNPAHFPHLKHLHLEGLENHGDVAAHHAARHAAFHAGKVDNQKAIVFSANEDEETESKLKRLTLINCKIILKQTGLMVRGRLMVGMMLRRIYADALLRIEMH